MRMTVNKPVTVIAKVVPLKRRGITIKARKTIMTPVPVINPPMTMKTLFNQFSIPGTAFRI